MKDQKVILVTGGSGYIGSILVPGLIESGYKIRVIDIGYFGHDGLENVRDRIELIEDDIRNCSKDVFGGVSGVIHLAGFSNDPTAEYNPAQNFSVNFDGTRRIVDLAKSAGVERFIFGSTCSVYYTDRPDDTINTEKAAIFPKAPYSLSKHLAEQYLLAQRSAQFSPVVMRKGTVYGLSPRMRYDLAINTMVKNAFINRSLILHSGGWMWRPFVEIQDAVAAYLFLLERPGQDIAGHIYNLVSFNKLVKDIAHDIQSVVKREFGINLVMKDEKTGPQRSYRVSGERLGGLGFAVKSDFSDSIKNMWKTLESGVHDLGEARYYNIRMFEYIFPKEV